MKHILSQDGLQVIKELTGRRTLYAFDFDGTLCPIISRASQSSMSEKTAKLLHELANRLPVAIISGRSLRDLSYRVVSERIRLVGNHGSEGAFANENHLEFGQICSEWVKFFDLNAVLEDLKFEVFLENKALSLSIHYRNAKDQKKVKTRLLDVIGRLTPAPKVVDGKSVLNLVPPNSPNKADALLELMRVEDCEAALFVGDDFTDEDVFHLKDPRVIGVRVGESTESGAGYFLRDQNEIDLLLESVSLK